MTIVLKNLNDLKRSIDIISTFISEGNLRFNDKGLALKAIDSSQIILVDFSIPAKAFDSFVVEPNLVGIDFVELNKIFQRAQPNDVLEIDLSDSDLLIRLKGDVERNFRLPLIDVQEADNPLPEINFDVEMELNAKILKESLKDASLFGSSVVLRVKGNQFIIEARGSQGNLKTVASNSSNVKIKQLQSGKNEVVSKYSLSFFSNIFKDADQAQKVLLYLKSDKPVKVDYKIGQASFKFYLAHMIL